MNIFKFDSLYAGETTLACPTCGSEHTQQDGVAIYTRPGGEDTPTHTVTDHDGHDMIGLGNPSARRHGLRFRFTGECGHRWYLEFAQHKGTTLVTVVPRGTEE